MIIKIELRQSPRENRQSNFPTDKTVAWHKMYKRESIQNRIAVTQNYAIEKCTKIISSLHGNVFSLMLFLYSTKYMLFVLRKMFFLFLNIQMTS